jgi:hypothetical protein
MVTVAMHPMKKRQPKAMMDPKAMADWQMGLSNMFV